MDKIAGKVLLELYDQEADAVFRLVFFRTKSREQAEDIVQETFFRLGEALENGKDAVINKRAYLYRIARNLIIDSYRKKEAISLDQLVEEGFDIKELHSLSPEIRLDAEALLDLFHKLPSEYQEILWLRLVEEWAVKAIAEYIGETENNISVKIHRGKKMLQQMSITKKL